MTEKVVSKERIESIKQSIESPTDMLSKTDIKAQIAKYEKELEEADKQNEVDPRYLRLTLSLYINLLTFVCQNKIKDFAEFMDCLNNYQHKEKESK